jgi:hypothetical protein
MKITVKNNQVIAVYDNDANQNRFAPDLYVIFVPSTSLLKPKMVKKEIAVPVFHGSFPPKSKIETTYEQDGYVYPWTNEEWNNDTKLASIRLQRNYLLQQTDWTALNDVPLSPQEKTAYENYRQQLRDFPDVVNVNLPIEQIIWPTKP